MIRAFVMVALVALGGCPNTSRMPGEPAPIKVAPIEQGPIEQAPDTQETTDQATAGQTQDTSTTDAQAATDTKAGTQAADAPPPVPTLADKIGAQCTRKGGEFRETPSGGFACFRTPKDAGKRCTKAGDCETLCLAESQTCAPITPLFGCHDILSATGARMTYCTN